MIMFIHVYIYIHIHGCVYCEWPPEPERFLSSASLDNIRLSGKSSSV